MYFATSPWSSLSSSSSANMDQSSSAVSTVSTAVDITDIASRRESFASSTRSNSCAFPSWPYRSCLLAAAADEASSYLSDEDLFPSSDSERPETPTSELTTEEQIEMFRGMAERKEQQPELWQPQRWCAKQKEVRLTLPGDERQKKRRSSSGTNKRRSLTPRTLKPISERG